MQQLTLGKVQERALEGLPANPTHAVRLLYIIASSSRRGRGVLCAGLRVLQKASPTYAFQTSTAQNYGGRRQERPGDAAHLQQERGHEGRDGRSQNDPGGEIRSCEQELRQWARALRAEEDLLQGQT
ncbi:hypothetical protein R1flu_011895 [Riccia fluitans]|uniref:Uncharacterized protein n=1 Tax=Riccia fluitans TaxID=41844 RepID=A0ABD1Z922_9MARC